MRSLTIKHDVFRSILDSIVKWEGVLVHFIAPRFNCTMEQSLPFISKLRTYSLIYFILSQVTLYPICHFVIQSLVLRSFYNSSPLDLAFTAFDNLSFIALCNASYAILDQSLTCGITSFKYWCTVSHIPVILLWEFTIYSCILFPVFYLII